MKYNKRQGEEILTIDFSRLLHRVDNGAAIHHVMEQKHDIAHVKDVTILAAARDAIENGKEISLEYTIANTDRSVGAMLAGAVAKKYGQAGLPEQTIHIKFKGSAGQSFGAFLTHGISFKLEGEANDYLGKGLSGGRIAVLPPCAAISMRKRIPSPETPCCMALLTARCISTDEWVNASQSAIPE